jgi:CheY-like chemotaxis protein
MAQVLCLDDDESVARLISDVVAFLGHQPVVETSSLDAISSHLREPRVKAVLTDYMMPRMDGLEVLEVFRLERPDVRRVLITAAPNEELVRKAVRDGLAQMVIAKPPAIGDIKVALAWL